MATRWLCFGAVGDVKISEPLFSGVMSNSVLNSLLSIGQQTRTSARQLAVLSTAERDRAIECIAQALEQDAEAILAANKADCLAADIAPALFARLKLDADKLTAGIAGVRDVAELADPIGVMQIKRELDADLILERVSCPVGVLGVIFEARPDAVIQIVSLAIKSGNGVILKGGQEALQSCTQLVKTIKEGLKNSAVSPDVVQLLTTREEIRSLLELDKYVDLIVPRGSNSFVRYVQENTKIPVLGHAEGICHLYVDRQVDIGSAIEICVDAKVQYPAACNAVETILVHQDIAADFLPSAVAALQSAGVVVKLDLASQQILGDPQITLATEADWDTEYSDLIVSIGLVASLEQAIEHVNTHGSRHTEGILTKDPKAAEVFMANVDAAGVFHNCSLRFADGFRYGFGAEVGISTQKMPPRGPVGLEGLVTYKYRLHGQGQVVATYTGKSPKSFTHKDLL
jgi:glutamate-5-semialdehyde dehydrogenase